jgi:hypothetical protein
MSSTVTSRRLSRACIDERSAWSPSQWNNTRSGRGDIRKYACDCGLDPCKKWRSSPFLCTFEESHQLWTGIPQACIHCPSASSGPRSGVAEEFQPLPGAVAVGLRVRVRQIRDLGTIPRSHMARMAREGMQVTVVRKAATFFRLRISLRTALTVRRSDKSLMDSRLSTKNIPAHSLDCAEE